MDGSRKGEELVFGDDAEMIVFGRDEATCQVLFGEDAEGVAQEHCALMNMGGQYTLYVNEGNACLVNGEPASEEHELSSLETSTELQLGEGGPRVEMMRTALLAAGARKAGEEAGDQEGGGEGEAEAAQEKPAPAHTPKAPWILAALGSAALVLIALGVVAGRRSRPVVTAPPAQATEQPPEQATEQREEDLYAGLFPRSEGRDTARDPLHTIEPMELEFADAFKAARSVYLVVERIGKAERARGTAWVAAPGTLATSARAAGAPGKRDLVVRSSGRNPVTLEVVTIQVHPGFGVLRDIAGSYMPVLDDESGRAKALPPGRPCDVALLEVRDADAHRLGAPLTLTTSATAVGEMVCTVGFASSESRVVVLERPQASFDVGSVLGLVDGFGEPADAETADLVRHALPEFAGVEGSPVLNSKGEVVAILSEGDDDDRQFAVPASVVAELVEGRAGAAQARREKRWRSAMDAYESRLAILREQALADWERGLGKSTACIFRREEVAHTKASQSAAGKAAHASVAVDEAGPIIVLVTSKRAIVVAGAERYAVTIKAAVTERYGPNTEVRHECQPLGAHGLYEYIATTCLRAKGKTQLEITATSDDPGGTDIEVTVYRAVETECLQSQASQEAPASQEEPAAAEAPGSQDASRATNEPPTSIP